MLRLSSNGSVADAFDLVPDDEKVTRCGGVELERLSLSTARVTMVGLSQKHGVLLARDGFLKGDPKKKCTFIDCWCSASNTLCTLYIHKRLTNVLSASISDDRSLLTFTTMRRTKAGAKHSTAPLPASRSMVVAPSISHSAPTSANHNGRAEGNMRHSMGLSSGIMESQAVHLGMEGGQSQEGGMMADSGWQGSDPAASLMARPQSLTSVNVVSSAAQGAGGQREVCEGEVRGERAHTGPKDTHGGGQTGSTARYKAYIVELRNQQRKQPFHLFHRYSKVESSRRSFSSSDRSRRASPPTSLTSFVHVHFLPPVQKRSSVNKMSVGMLVATDRGTLSLFSVRMQRDTYKIISLPKMVCKIVDKHVWYTLCMDTHALHVLVESSQSAASNTQEMQATQTTKATPGCSVTTTTLSTGTQSLPSLLPTFSSSSSSLALSQRLAAAGKCDDLVLKSFSYHQDGTFKSSSEIVVIKSLCFPPSATVNQLVEERLCMLECADPSRDCVVSPWLHGFPLHKRTQLFTLPSGGTCLSHHNFCREWGPLDTSTHPNANVATLKETSSLADSDRDGAWTPPHVEGGGGTDEGGARGYSSLAVTLIVFSLHQKHSVKVTLPGSVDPNNTCVFVDALPCDYVLIFVPGLHFQLIDCSPHHDPCTSLCVTGAGRVPLMPDQKRLGDASFFLPVLSRTGLRRCLLDVQRGVLYEWSVAIDALARLFDDSTLEDAQMHALHYAALHHDEPAVLTTILVYVLTSRPHACTAKFFKELLLATTQKELMAEVQSQSSKTLRALNAALPFTVLATIPHGGSAQRKRAGTSPAEINSHDARRVSLETINGAKKGFSATVSASCNAPLKSTQLGGRAVSPPRWERAPSSLPPPAVTQGSSPLLSSRGSFLRLLGIPDNAVGATPALPSAHLDPVEYDLFGCEWTLWSADALCDCLAAMFPKETSVKLRAFSAQYFQAQAKQAKIIFAWVTKYMILRSAHEPFPMWSVLSNFYQACEELKCALPSGFCSIFLACALHTLPLPSVVQLLESKVLAFHSSFAELFISELPAILFGDPMQSLRRLCHHDMAYAPPLSPRRDIGKDAARPAFSNSPAPRSHPIGNAPSGTDPAPKLALSAFWRAAATKHKPAVDGATASVVAAHESTRSLTAAQHAFYKRVVCMLLSQLDDPRLAHDLQSVYLPVRGDDPRLSFSFSELWARQTETLDCFLDLEWCSTSAFIPASTYADACVSYPHPTPQLSDSSIALADDNASHREIVQEALGAVNAVFECPTCGG